MRILGRTIVATVATGLLMLAPPGEASESAPDERRCVAKPEMNGYSGTQTKRAVEARWEVAGLGKQRYVPIFGLAVIYPRCGKAKGRFPDVFYGMAYERRGGRWWVVAQIFNFTTRSRP